MKTIRMNNRIHTPNRSGSVGVFLCFLLLPLLALIALSVDYGFLLYVQTDLQRAADQAAVAAVRDLVPDDNGDQDLVQVRATIREYIEKNLGGGFTVRDEDIEIGRYDPSSIYSSVSLLNDGILDTVRFSVRRDDLANSSVSLYFARLFNKDQSDVSATAAAVLQKARYLGPGAAVLPIAISEQTWSRLAIGEVVSIYGDGKIKDEFGQNIPGNWGTIDIGPTNNSTNALRDQILNGLTQNDLDSLYQQGVIPDPSRIDSQQIPTTMNGDTGFSAGIKNAITQIYGQKRLVPIYDKTSGKGGNMDFDVIGWGAVEVIDSFWQGSKNSRVEVKKVYTFDGSLRPGNNLTNTSLSIEGVFTSPVLVQ